MGTNAALRRMAMDEGIRGIFPDIQKVSVYIDNELDPPDEALARLIDGMKALHMDALLLDGGRSKLLISKHEYGDSFAAISYDCDIAPADLSRLVQLLFARAGDALSGDRVQAPAHVVESALELWQRKIGLVFGHEFAGKLIVASLHDKNKASMTPDDLEAVRAYLSSAIGDCLHLDKVDK